MINKQKEEQKIIETTKRNQLARAKPQITATHPHIYTTALHAANNLQLCLLLHTKNVVPLHPLTYLALN